MASTMYRVGDGSGILHGGQSSASVEIGRNYGGYYIYLDLCTYYTSFTENQLFDTLLYYTILYCTGIRNGG